MTADPTPAAVELRGLVKRFDRFVAVDGIDLRIQPGELFGLLGPNGAGKTTTLLMLAGMLRPSAGAALIFGHDIHADPVPPKRLLAFIPDRPFLYEKLTGRELLGYVDELYAGPAATRAARAEALLQRFSLRDFGDELVEGYSHGMRQRLVIACALMHSPRLLVVDEPLVGLDPQGARLVLTVFRELCATGGTVIMSTHTLQIAEELCDRIAIVARGRVAALGTMAELRQRAAADRRSLEDIFMALTGGGQPAPA